MEIKGGWDYLGIILDSAATILIIQISVVLGSKQDDTFYLKIERCCICGFYYLRCFCSYCIELCFVRN